MLFDPDIHHRRSIRLPDFDYAAAGACFVTICVQGKACLFGAIDNGELTLSEAGRMVDAIWQELPARYPNLTLDEHIVMPDHFHGIIVINAPSLPPSFPIYRGRRPNGTLDGSVGRVVQAFKSLATNQYIHGVKNHGWPPFAGRLWQRNYYERVIRSDVELQNIRGYIRTNPGTCHPGTEDQNPYG